MLYTSSYSFVSGLTSLDQSVVTCPGKCSFNLINIIQQQYQTQFIVIYGKHLLIFHWIYLVMFSCVSYMMCVCVCVCVGTLSKSMLL